MQDIWREQEVYWESRLWGPWLLRRDQVPLSFLSLAMGKFVEVPIKKLSYHFSSSWFHLATILVQATTIIYSFLISAIVYRCTTYRADKCIPYEMIIMMMFSCISQQCLMKSSGCHSGTPIIYFLYSSPTDPFKR